MPQAGRSQVRFPMMLLEFFIDNPSGRTMAPGSTHPLKEMSTRYISWRIKAASAYGRQSYNLNVPLFLKSSSLNLLERPVPVQACTGIAYLYLNSQLAKKVIFAIQVQWSHRV